MIEFEQVWKALTFVEPEDKELAKLFYELGRCFAMEHAADIENMATLYAVKAFIESPDTGERQ